VGGLHVHVSYILVELDRYRCETAVSSNNGMLLLVYERGVLEFCHFCHFRSKRHVLRRQIRDLHRSAAEISSFSLLGAVSRREIVYRLRATGISLMIEVIGFRILLYSTTVQLYMYRECLGIPSQCFFMPKKCPKKTSLPAGCISLHTTRSTV
jgi:hypothetical protein